MRTHNLVMIVILLIFSISSVIAFEPSCPTEGCSNVFPIGSGNTPNTLYSAITRNFPSNGTYNKCIIPGSRFTPISADYNSNTIPDIVIVPDSTTVDIYDTLCSFRQSLPVNATTQPIFIDFYDDGVPEMVVLSPKSLNIYSPQNGYYFLTKSINLSSVTALTYDYLACSRNYDAHFNAIHCMAFRRNGAQALSINISYDGINANASEITSFFSTNMFSATILPNEEGMPAMDYITNIVDPDDDTEFILNVVKTKAMICGQSITSGNQMTCTIANIDEASRQVSSYPSLLSASTVVSSFNRLTATPIQLSSNFPYYAVDAEYVKSFTKYHNYYIMDAIGTVKLNLTSGVNGYLQNSTSNIMVADYNKDGLNELCFVQNETVVSNSTYFICYDQALQNRIVEIDYTGILNITKNFVLIDYDKTASTLFLANYEGIYNETAKIKSFDYVSVDPFRSPMLTQYPGVGSNVIAFSDTSNTYLFFEPVVSYRCGDGTCDAGVETAIMCPSDCGNSSVECYTNTDCTAIDQFYPICLHNRCVRNPTTGCTPETELADCKNLSSPICYIDTCIGGFRSTPPAQVLPGSTQQGENYKDTLANAIDYVTGANPFFKFIAAIILALATTVITYQALAEYSSGQPSVVIPLIFGFVMFTFTAMFSMIPIRFVVTIALIIIMISVFGFFIISKMDKGGG